MASPLHLQPLAAETVEGDHFGTRNGLREGCKQSFVEPLNAPAGILQGSSGKLGNGFCHRARRVVASVVKPPDDQNNLSPQEDAAS